LVDPALLFDGLLDEVIVPVSVGHPSGLYGVRTLGQEALDSLG
jgi:hypothetical protein